MIQIDIDNNPGALGLEEVIRWDDGQGGYDWTLLIVWRRLCDGVLFFYGDSGCSCNSFGDGLSGIDGLTALTNATLPELEQFLDTHDYEGTAESRSDFKHKARLLLK